MGNRSTHNPTRAAASSGRSPSAALAPVGHRHEIEPWQRRLPPRDRAAGVVDRSRPSQLKHSTMSWSATGTRSLFAAIAVMVVWLVSSDSSQIGALVDESLVPASGIDAGGVAGHEALAGSRLPADSHSSPCLGAAPRHPRCARTPGSGRPSLDPEVACLGHRGTFMKLISLPWSSQHPGVGVFCPTMIVRTITRSQRRSLADQLGTFAPQP